MVTPPQPVQGTVISPDGTVIEYERSGAGPALILVDAAGHHRSLSSFGGLVPLLADDFTVYEYDRRGRGGSTDTPPYAVQREVEDLAALVERAGGVAFLHGFSSGALVALQAAVSGLAIPRMTLLEPPVGTDEERSEQWAFTRRLVELVGAGRRESAVKFFLSGIGVPEEVLAEMLATPSWTDLMAVAHTLVYDSLLSEATTFGLLASVPARTLVVDSQGSSDDVVGMAGKVAAGIPRAQHRSLPGEWHGVPDDVLAGVLAEFFSLA